MSLSERLSSLATDERAHENDTHPQIFSLALPAARAALEVFLSSGNPLFCHDTLEAQVGELVETRSPDRKLPPEEIREHALTIARGDFATYGSWVFFPWSRRLVHVLPEREYEELRTSRNRNKITRKEQDVLGRLVVGIAGLSVGQSTAVTLALEGVGGHFRLADFDTLSLSNMNRLRAGVHEIGVKKAYLVAREIYEINPYAKIELFDRGITDDTIDAFFSGNSSVDAPLDLLFEECDDLKMKVRLRHEARKRKIAVLMETSDRGLFDVERFDREPTRPPFHGLVGELDPEQLTGMTTYEKVPIVLAIIGAKTMSKRMAASLVDIDATLKTWPQLASAVALGGAINTDAARRIALGKMKSSGRFFVDMERIISDAPMGEEVAAPATAAAIDSPAPTTATRSTRALGGSIPREQLEQLVRLASLAPSGGNCQPWRFRIEKDSIVCIHDVERSRTLLDFEHRATYAAFGALSENLRLGAAKLGLGIAIQPFPRASDLVVCIAELGGPATPLTSDDARLLEQIELRVTNRRLSRRVAISESDAGELGRIAEESRSNLRLITDEAKLTALGDILGMGDRLRLMSPVMHREMMGEMRWSKEATARTRDGLDLLTMEMTPTDEAGMRLIADWSVMSVVREIEGGHGLAQASRKSVAAAAAVGLLTVPRPPGSQTRLAYFSGGIAMQRVWLAAAALGYAFQPLSALPYLFARLADGNGDGLDDRERRELGELRQSYRSIFGLAPDVDQAEIMLFRLAKAAPPTARSLRRTPEDLIDDT